jgi:hypothetical protein
MSNGNPDNVPSLVALAVASAELETAATYVGGVRDWLERNGSPGGPPTAEQFVALWAFATRTHNRANALAEDAQRVTELLARAYFAADGSWPLSPEQEREFHEVLAALATREVEEHGATAPPAAPADEG